jgi:hypothetical protein
MHSMAGDTGAVPFLVYLQLIDGARPYTKPVQPALSSHLLSRPYSQSSSF